jgi:hypothetical protein
MFFLARCRHAPQFCGRLFRRTQMDATDGGAMCDDTTGAPPLARSAFGYGEAGPSSTAAMDNRTENEMAGHELQQLSSRSSLTVPRNPRLSHAPTGNPAFPPSAGHRPRMASPASQTTTGGSDINMSSAEDNPSDMETASPGPRITRKTRYDKSKTVPWVVCVRCSLLQPWGCITWV